MLSFVGGNKEQWHVTEEKQVKICVYIINK